MKVLLLVMMFCSGLGFASGIQDSGQRIPVRVGIHNNGGGSSLAAVALECGFFAKYGIDPIFTIVESGKTEMVAMRAAERLCGKQTGTFDVTDLEMFTQSEYEWYFAESEGCEYIRSLYANARKLLPEAVPVKPFDKICDKTLMINAILNNKNS